MISETTRRSLVLQAVDVEFLAVADHLIDLCHLGEGRRCQLRGAAGDDDAALWIGATQFTNALACLADGFAGYGAGVYVNSIGDAGGGSFARITSDSNEFNRQPKVTTCGPRMGLALSSRSTDLGCR